MIPLALVLGLSLLSLSLPGCAYIAKQAEGQLKLLAGRVPIEQAIEEVEFSPEERELLDWLPRIKAFGEEVVGLKPTPNYTTINPDFAGVIWNVSAAAPDRFLSHRYNYPIVGALPYIGFWDKDDAKAEVARLQALGWETYMRTAGAYSTLGWFRDPLWRSMLAWDFERFVNTVLHELAHATLWLPGQGKFNESFASFLGDEATKLFLQHIEPEYPEYWARHTANEVDRAQYRAFMHRLVRRLEGLYGAGLSRERVASERARVIEEGRAAYGELEWQNEGWGRALRKSRKMNNARLGQFRVYNTGMDDFDRALARFDNDLAALIRAATEELPRAQRRGGRNWDPYQAIQQLEP